MARNLALRHHDLCFERHPIRVSRANEITGLGGARRHLSDRLSELSGVPVMELTALLIALPLVATVTGWLLAGREPAAITRAALD